MKFFESQIEINAPADVVWGHLTDFASYPDWNPFIRRARGDLTEGSIVHFQVARVPVPMTAPITSLKPNEELTWEARFLLPGLQPKYIRRLEAIDNNRTRFINREEFTGGLASLAFPLLNVLVGSLYAKTCEALKARVEKAT